MKHSTFDPQKVSCFEKGKLNFSGQSVLMTVLSGEIKEVDLLLTDDFLITGGTLLVKGGIFGDSVSLCVVHPVHGIVNTFVVGYFISEDVQRQFCVSLPYPAKLSAGLAIRLIYTATSAISTRSVALNYELHKVLI